MNFTCPQGIITSGFVGEFMKAQNAALITLEERTCVRDADAVVGIDFKYEVHYPHGVMLVVTDSETALKLE